MFRRALWWGIPTLLVLLLGSVHLPTPFTGDQALYSLAGEMIASGGVMHRDIWDIKHPGVHHFYAIGHVLGVGGVELRVHALELLMWIGFGLFSQAALRPRLRHPFLAAGIPLTTAGAYYASVGSWHLTQIEAIPGPLIWIAAWMAAPSADGRIPGTARSVAAGALASVAVIFHGHMWPVPIVILAWAAVCGGGWRRVGAMAGGLIGTLAVFFGGLALRGAAAGLTETYLTYPPAAHREVPAELQGPARVRRAVLWFVRSFFPWIGLAAASIAAWPRARRDALIGQQVLWIAAGVGVMAFETRTSWPFHLLYFVVPIGTLAVYGVDALFRFAPGRYSPPVRWAALVVFLIALGPSVRASWLGYARSLMPHITEGSFDAYRHESSRLYRELWEDTAFLRESTSRPGAIYVLGDPLMYTLSGRRQAIVRNGWGYEVALQSHWDELANALAEAAPPYIYLTTEYVPMVAEKATSTEDLLARDYRVLKRVNTGVWYEAR